MGLTFFAGEDAIALLSLISRKHQRCSEKEEAPVQVQDDEEEKDEEKEEDLQSVLSAQELVADRKEDGRYLGQDTALVPRSEMCYFATFN